MNLDDFTKLNPKDIGNWPIIPKVLALCGLFVLILFAGYWFDWQNQLADLDAAKEKESQLRETFISKKKQVVNLDTYRRQLKDLEQAFGALIKQLPNKAEMDALLTDINQAGLGRGLEFELFRPANNEILSEFYAERPISIRVTGNYHDLGAFASDVSRLPRIVTLNEINITPSGQTLTMSAVAKTYRYLDENELAAQKAAQRKSAKEAKK
ncbi:pilus assembly protein PilO [Sulfuricella denitrificans skB26]|uniref:Pilus assembly protein PilO n=1 Tax=Sulfuricella denitrificans (strain DSM 22764 / NBRC 105220 / skB26) TaxID=1163617 RepID=S6B8U2_SULDS|nr:type 4a pilus biogenesis protein PilO [Sulfuricella denitrificans]BAN36742.1 pilus assembly protein PilO [Sulfuricella denitrificans skB26]